MRLVLEYILKKNQNNLREFFCKLLQKNDKLLQLTKMIKIMCYKKREPTNIEELGGNSMKFKKLLKRISTSGVLASFALCMATVAANSECFYVFHQSELPDNLKKYRKF